MTCPNCLLILFKTENPAQGGQQKANEVIKNTEPSTASLPTPDRFDLFPGDVRSQNRSSQIATISTHKPCQEETQQSRNKNHAAPSYSDVEKESAVLEQVLQKVKTSTG